VKLILLIATLLWIPSCGRSPVPPRIEAAGGPHPEDFTHWSALTELFVEYPALVAGRNSRFAIHLTRLDTFKPLASGRAEVVLNYGPGQESVFAAEAPSRPGIFGVDVTPPRTGEALVLIRFRGEGLTDAHEVGRIAITAAPPAAHEHPEPPASEVSFLKEQQWVLDFATGLAEERRIAESLRVPAEVEARAGGSAEVDAPYAGRLRIDRLPTLGAPVTEGQILGYVVLPAPNPADFIGPKLARSEAETALEIATRDFERARRLVEGGAAPARRLEEAQAALGLARARHEAANERVRELESSRQSEGEATVRSFAIKAPLSGRIERILCTSGTAVQAGDVLFQIADLDRVLIAAIVPESEYPRIHKLSAAELEIPGREQPRSLSRPLRIGRIVDSATRTFPVTFEYDNRDRTVAINQTVHVRLLLGAAPAGPAVPVEAIVDDNGSPVLYVQIGGESFERRPVRLGDRASGFVRVIGGLKSGERVVTRGAHLIRLASLAGSAPAHGHVH
jgi:cobalt-zinc-cadmium efflux system membrane fusion protein